MLLIPSSLCCIIFVFVLVSEIQPSNVISNIDTGDFVNGKTHYKQMIWDPLHKKTSFVFNISGNSPLHIILTREKRSHCEMFFLRFTDVNILRRNGSSEMTVCVAELKNNYLKEKCEWLNNTESLVVNQGNLYGMPKDCGPWYLTVFVTGSSGYSNTTELAVDVSEPYDPLAFRWLRVLTNIAFIPGIIIAFRRSFYAECIVYFLNLNLSWVYHLCEAELHCFKGYSRLHNSDIYSSDLSIIVTVWAMTGIRAPLKHLIYLTVAILLQFAVGETTDSQYHFFVNLIFNAIPACFLFYQYVIRSIKHRHCYPSRKRWAFYLFPGLSLATAGALTNLMISESYNYYYVHCIWHLTIMLSVAFLLPLKEGEFEDDEWYREEFDKSTYTPLV